MTAFHFFGIDCSGGQESVLVYILIFSVLLVLAVVLIVTLIAIIMKRRHRIYQRLVNDSTVNEKTLIKEYESTMNSHQTNKEKNLLLDLNKF